MIEYVKGLPHSECMLVYNWEFKKIRILSFIIISCDVAFFLKFQQNTTLSYIVLPYNKSSLFKIWFFAASYKINLCMVAGYKIKLCSILISKKTKILNVDQIRFCSFSFRILISSSKRFLSIPLNSQTNEF